MQPFEGFAHLDRSFWAHVKLVSEILGYSERATRQGQYTLRRYQESEVVRALRGANLYQASGPPPAILGPLLQYLNQRAEALEKFAAPNLMKRAEAAAEFEQLRTKLKPKCALPLNKQKGEKKHPAYMVGIVNMLTEHALSGRSFDDNPRGLTVVTRGGNLLRTFSRWMDGAYPSRVDPHAIWEVKEYYGTTTFGSRVADGVYESMLDGEECAELLLREERKVHHYLIVDDHFTWWVKGRSYLCRVVDAVHVGLVDEAIFGREVLTRWPEIVSTWP
jgi:hypothetical protein